MDNLALAIESLLVAKEADSNSPVIQRRFAASIYSPIRGWPECSGTVAGLHRNGWPESIGISGRNGPENAIRTYRFTKPANPNASQVSITNGSPPYEVSASPDSSSISLNGNSPSLSATYSPPW
jgi:hypothetical protein